MEISFDKCLLATGGRPKSLPVFSEAPANLKERVSLYRAIPDYQKLDDLVGKAELILVVGGGFLGSELAVGIASRGNKMNNLSPLIYLLAYLSPLPSSSPLSCLLLPPVVSISPSPF